MGKKVAAAPAAKKAGGKKATVAKDWHSEHSHLFEKNTRVFRIGKDIPPKRDLSRSVKWPRYIRIQRQRSIIKKRLKVPPAVNQFSHTLEKNQAGNIFRLFSHYRPESKEQKHKRLKDASVSEAKEAGSSKTGPKPVFLKYGLNHVTNLIESKKAKLVVIAHDVDPLELVVWLPALCRKLNVPYAIVKGKARLGHLIYKKTASVLALTEVRKEDAAKLEQIIQSVRLQFNDNVNDRKKFGGGSLGPKRQAVIRVRERTAARELAAKA